MESDNEPMVLTLLTGPQVGAEIALAAGGVRVGSDDQDDIVVRGNGVAAHHLRIGLSEDRIQLLADAGSIATADGVLAPGEEQTLAAPALIDVGSIRIGIGAPGTDWYGPVPIAAAPVEPTQDTDVDEGRSPAPASGATSPRWWMRRPVWIGVPLVVIAGGTALTLTLSGTDNRVPTAPTPAQQVEKARGLILGSSCPGVTAHGSNEGLALTGYCDRADHLAALMASLSKAGLVFDSNVHVLARMRRQISDTLAQLDGGDLKIELSDNGVLRVHGFYSGNLPAEELRTDLRTDIAGVTKVELSIRTLRDAQDELRKMVADSKLAGILLVEAKQGGLVVTAPEGTSIAESDWQKIAAAFDKASGGVPQIRADIEFAPAKKSAAAPGSESTGAPPRNAWRLTAVILAKEQEAFAVLKDHGEVRVGDHLGASYVVSEIRPESVVLSSPAGERILKLHSYE